MADIPTPQFADLTAIARDVISAHEAISEGIATHAEKHHAAQEQQRVKLEADRRLTGGILEQKQ